MIDVSGVTRHFVGISVLHNVTFQVERGQTYVILGQSGSGKSVLLKILAGLLTPDEGHVRIQSRNRGMLFQKNALFDSLTASENLDFPLREKSQLNLSQRKEKIQYFLKSVGLEGCENLFPHELSGGMQKRLGIARALIIEPEVIFYDEPTAGLDPITSRMIVDLIIEMKKKHSTTIVAVTSDVLRAFQMADQLGLLVRTHTGAHLIPAGTPQQAKASTDPAIQQFIQGLTSGPLTNDLDKFVPQPSSLAELCAELENDPF